MSLVLGGLVFFGIVFGILFALHYYLWARLVRDPAPPAPWRAIATWLLVVLGASLPSAMTFGRVLAPAQARWLAWPAFVWMGLLFFLFVFLLLGDLARHLINLFSPGTPADPARRQLLARTIGGAAAGLSSAVGLIAVRTARGPVAVKDVTVPLSRLPRELDGFTIAQLTDVHIGPTLDREFLEEVVARTNALQPDLIAITGDLVDGSVAHLREHVAPLANLRARHGTFFVTGNHEYYSGVDEWLEELTRMGVRCLRNERVAIGEGSRSFDLAGIDDYSSLGFARGHGPDLPRALAGRDPSRELVLLAHQPRAIHEAARHGVGLQLSGHTHGGQIWPWTYMVYLQQPYVAGLAREGNTQLYVSCGTGYWGPPMRLGAPAEITRVVLRAS
jgi:predicted MPP superfamily phosphohydrolase